MGSVKTISMTCDSGASDFTEKEVDLITEAGATAVGLGPHRLRVETATIAILATLTLWFGSQQISNS